MIVRILGTKKFGFNKTAPQLTLQEYHWKMRSSSLLGDEFNSPARSPDLNHLTLHFGSYPKLWVFKHRSKNLEEPKAVTRVEIVALYT